MSHSSSKWLIELHPLQKRHKHVYTSTKDSILTTEDDRLDLLVSKCSLHRVNDAPPHCCAVKSKTATLYGEKRQLVKCIITVSDISIVNIDFFYSPYCAKKTLIQFN